MKISKQLHQVLFISMFLILCKNASATDCIGLPSDESLLGRLQILVDDSAGGEVSDQVSIVAGPLYTCQVQGTTKGTYQELSAIVEYSIGGSNTVMIRQFEMDCISVGMDTGWEGRTGSLQTVDGSLDYTNIAVFTNCSSCTSSASNDNHCQECHSDCNVGLMRCSGTASSQCCVVFEDDGACSASLNCSRVNFFANQENNFTCSCSLPCELGFNLDTETCSCVLSDICQTNMSTCDNGGECLLSSPPDNFSCNCIGTRFTGRNCSVCDQSCDPGYELDMNSCSCLLTDICLTSSPTCENGGMCILESAPDTFICNCTGTRYSGTICTICELNCSRGYTVNSENCTCTLRDICEATMPTDSGQCENGGICTLISGPDQFSCDCTNTDFTGERCSLIKGDVDFQLWWIILIIAIVLVVSIITIIICIVMCLKLKCIRRSQFV